MLISYPPFLNVGGKGHRGVRRPPPYVLTERDGPVCLVRCPGESRVLARTLEKGGNRKVVKG